MTDLINTESSTKRVSLFIATLFFAMGDMAFGAQTTSLLILMNRQQNGNIIPLKDLTSHLKLMEVPVFCWETLFYSVGGLEIDKFTGFEGEINKDIWTFDFITRKWTNLGKTAVNLSPYKIVQKDSLFYLFGHPIDTEQNLVVDLKNNNVLFYNQGFTSANISKSEPAFFREDSLYYFKNNQLYGKH
ncbi:MAG: hypothetical protein CM15mP83_1200 [Flavobacteriaceae bacterium]|nr:MAG: hypothetical protein CM15mP83_1200 [Flavobacteriaceae bacterium]